MARLVGGPQADPRRAGTVLLVLDDFVQMWSAKEAGRDGLVPASFADEQNRRRLRQAALARALCIVAVVELAVLLFVATSWPTAAMAVAWASFGLTLLVALVVAVRSLSALARVESAADREGRPQPTPDVRPHGSRRRGGRAGRSPPGP